MTRLADLSLAALLIAALVSAALTLALLPLLKRYALARLSARSSHTVPTPQGAGIAVIIATLMVAGIVISVAIGQRIPATLFAATLVIALIGAIDDIRPIAVLPRLLLQSLCAIAVLYAASSLPQIVPAAPLWLERVLLFVAVLWFVNLVNFMDGIDLMTVVEVVPTALALTVAGWLGALAGETTLIAAALAGAALGFAPFNRPVAKVFLGDVGSLPIGLLLAWCLVELAARQSLVAALLLPLYYLVDATATLLRRLVRGEKVWVAHRSHYYQQATTNGYGVTAIVARVFVLNLLLAGLGLTAVLNPDPVTQAMLLIAGSVAVALTMVRFALPREALKLRRR